MNKSNSSITFKGNKVTVAGEELREGELFPRFVLTGTDMKDLTNATFSGKNLVIVSVPSFDTPVCATEMKRFNGEAAKLAPNVVVLAVSLDLPFAQKRWCAAEGATHVQTGSDYKHRMFGHATGTYIEDLGLLSRAVFVVDVSGRIRYLEYVSEIGSEPDYDAALSAVRSL